MATPYRPNVVFVLADDMGYGDIGCYNPESKIPTPHLDRMAEEGIRFTDAHAGSALCTPSRYALLTGRYCWRSRLKRGVLNGYSGPLLEEGRWTVASLLRDRGYHTACFGKWHLGWEWPLRSGSGEVKPDDPTCGVDFRSPIHRGPTTVGFQNFFGIPASLDMPPYCYVDGDRPTAPAEGLVGDSPWDAFWRAGPIAPDFRHAEVLPTLADRAVAYIREHGARDEAPFFLYFALPAPHTPVLPLGAFRGRSGAGDYGDFCVQIDDVVGRLMQALRETGADRNTLFLFSSDNGPESIAYERIRRYRHYSMDGLRGVKRDTWEGGHRVPLIARWPERIAPGAVGGQLVSLVDMMATAADIAGVELPEDAGEDSESMLPALEGRTMRGARREAIVYHAGDGTLAIRRGDWVFIDGPTGAGAKEPEWFRQERGYVPHDLPGELYHLGQDPSEARNLYASEPGTVEELKALLQRYKEAGRSVQRC